MATARREMDKIANRVRRVWGEDSVERGGGSSGWLYRINSPLGREPARIQLHATPKDTNWHKTVERDLRNAGFFVDEDQFLIEEEENKERQAREDKDRNERKLLEAEENAKSLVNPHSGPFGPQVATVEWVFARHEVPETKRVLITPELADKIVRERNTHNRPLRAARVEYWARIMRKNRWRFTHQGIALDTSGALQDGQHRLKAAAETGFMLDVLCSVGMPAENFTDIDTGAGRTGGDTMAVENKDFPFPNILAAAGKLVTAYDRGGSETRMEVRKRIPNDELREYVTKYGSDLEEYVIIARKISNRRGGPKMSPNALAAGIYLIARKLPKDDERVDEFIRGYAEGTDLVQGDARIALRDFMTNIRQPNRRVPVEDQLGVFLKSWNAWANGRGISFLSFRKDEQMPAVFVPKSRG